MKKAIKRSTLVTNELVTAPKLQTNQLQRFTWNLSTKLVRNGELEGRKCLIVPMVMMVEGVHNGSNGPILWPAEELGKTPEVYNAKPIVVNHPADENGRAISACSEEILNTRKIGIIMNTRFDSLNRLCADAYLDEERTKEVDVRIYNAVKKGEAMECSTGVYTDNEVKKGEWNNEHYEAIARNHRPDHLAVLPDDVGACSKLDGAGFIRNAVKTSFERLDPEDVELVRDRVIKILANEKNSKGAVGKLLKNEASHESVRQLLYKQMEVKYPSDKGYACPYIESVFDTWFVYYMGSKLFKLGYSSSDTGAKLMGEPVEVVRVTEYRAAPVSNQSASTPTHNRGKTMDKDQIVADLITNHGYAESDRGLLMGMDLAALTRIQASSTATLNKAKTAAPAATKTETTTNATVAPAAKPALTEKEFLEQAPPSVRAVLANSQRILDAEKAKHIATIKTNAKNRFSDVQLVAMDVEQLANLAELAAPPVTNSTAQNVLQHDFGGMGSAAPIENAAAKLDGASLGLPKWDFADAK